MSDITAHERQQLGCLRSRVEFMLTPKFDTDYNLLRFLRAWPDDFDQTVYWLERCLIARRAMNLDNIEETLTERCPISDDCTPISILGACATNAQNRIVVFDFPGKYDVHGLMKAIQPYPYMLQRYKLFEKLLRMVNEEEERAQQMSGVLWVYDLDGMQYDPSLLGVVVGPMKNMWTVLLNLYPGLIQKCLVINVPTTVNVLYTAFYPFVPNHSKDKIVMTGANWKEEVKEHIETKQLPVKWGGSLVGPDGDESCPNLIRTPLNPVPEELYWTPKTGEPKIDDMSEIAVTAASYKLISHEVFETDVIMNIYFHCAYDYGFAIFYTDDDEEDDLENMQEMYPNLVQSGIAACNHITYTCTELGIYHIKIGNEGAWMKSLGVKYMVEFTDQQGAKLHDVAVEVEH